MNFASCDQKNDTQKYLLLLVKHQHFSFISVTILHVRDFSLCFVARRFSATEEKFELSVSIFLEGKDKNLAVVGGLNFYSLGLVCLFGDVREKVCDEPNTPPRYI